MRNSKKKYHNCPHAGCTASFSRPYRLTDHMFSAHTNVRAYVCQEEGCNKSYSNKSHLIRHVNIVHKKLGNDDVIYSCPVCLKNYVNRQNLHRHMNTSHAKAPSFSCDLCHMHFKKKNQLKAHIFQHTGVKPFTCERCPKNFTSQFERKRHMRSHRIHQCSDCELKFDVWSKYQKHRQMVHNPKEYICNECGRSFGKRCHIVRHVKIHDVQQSLFSCPYGNCPRSYTRKNNLQAHILINHFQVKHECHLCEAKLSTKAVLNRHLKVHYQVLELTKEILKKPTESEQEMPPERKRRKDFGTMKLSTALRLAGLPMTNVKEEDAADVH